LNSNYIDDQKAYLTQAASSTVEATAMALGKVYTFGPTFRAENPKPAATSPNFGCSEPEAAYAELPDMMDLGEGLVSAIRQSVVKNNPRTRNLKRESRSSSTSSRPSLASPTKKPSAFSRTRQPRQVRR